MDCPNRAIRFALEQLYSFAIVIYILELFGLFNTYSDRGSYFIGLLSV